MNVSDFDFELPPHCIAQEPAAARDASRLLAHDVPRDLTDHLRFRDLPDQLRAGDLLVLNDTRVLSARLFARRRSGGSVELLFLEPQAHSPGVWRTLANPARKLRAGELLDAADGALEVRMIERVGMEWTAVLRSRDDPELGTEELLERHGVMPLPPYVERPRGAAEEAADRVRYQTIFAREPGAVAAPTAGLHFTDELFARLQEHDVARAFITLHVGPGTFRPVKVDRTEDHEMHSERFALPAETVQAIHATRRRGGRVVAVGTTAVRVLESVAARRGELVPCTGDTDLFLVPGARFRVVDGLLTNFHLPRSTLLMLVSAFAGRERVLRLYGEAVEAGYRFFSYGDAMLLWGQAPSDGATSLSRTT